ncbi:MAG: PH domain-containing protein [Coriobacteriales bacterium]|jgi:membrane protein YdbS with pleckstrin-like domain|nr:PH domain-containing protein [Coriobacteriales bacterium]
MRDLPSRRLDTRIKRVWRLSALIVVVLVLLAALITLIGIAAGVVSELGSTQERDTAFVVFYSIGAGLLAAGLLAAVAFVLVIPRLRYLRWRFEVYEEDIEIYRGILWRRRIVIPLVRVQNVDTKQGPVMRASGLASFTVATAAGEHEIPGLPVPEADELRERVAILARIAQEDV